MEETPKIIEKAYDVCDKYQEMISELKDIDLKKIFTVEMIKMGYLIAAIDGKLDSAELTTICSMLGVIINEDVLQKNYYEDCMTEDNFMTREPEIIKYISKYEQQKAEGMASFLPDTREIYKAFKQFGQMMITCNGYRMTLEVKLLDRYLSIMINYIISKESGNEFNTEPLSKINSDADFSVKNIGEMDQMNEVMKEIDALIGLDGVKKEVHNIINLLLVKKMREERGYKQPSLSMHLVFTGNPGTGKTTIARKLAKIYKYLGVLENGQLIEADRSGMVAGYMGQTAEKVNELAKSAFGGILFIDEAYTLASSSGNDDFGQEAIDTLLKIMEDHRENFMVIVAGYPEQMEKFLDSNPGLRSRFNKYIRFENYSIEELYKIFEDLCKANDYKFADGVKEKVLYNIGKMLAEEQENFANAREIRNYFERICSNQANRIVDMGNGEVDELLTITPEDVDVD